MPLPTEPKTALGAAIRRARKSAGMTGGSLALKLGLHQTTVSGWEAGDVVPSLEQLRAIEDATGTEHGALLKAGGYVGAVGDIEAAILAAVMPEDKRFALLHIVRSVIKEQED